PTQRRLAEQGLKAIAPTLKSGELDLGVALRGPNERGLFTVVAGVKVVEGQALDRAVRDIYEVLPESEKGKITLDAAKAGGHPVHRLNTDLPLDPNARRMFGDGPAYVGIRPDALVLALGPEAERAVGEALAARPRPAPLARAEATVGRLAQAAPPDSPER